MGATEIFGGLWSPQLEPQQQQQQQQQRFDDCHADDYQQRSVQLRGAASTNLGTVDGAVAEVLEGLGTSLDLVTLEQTLKEQEQKLYREIMANMHLSEADIAALPAGPREQYLAVRAVHRQEEEAYAARRGRMPPQRHDNVDSGHHRWGYGISPAASRHQPTPRSTPAPSPPPQQQLPFRPGEHLLPPSVRMDRASPRDTGKNRADPGLLGSVVRRRRRRGGRGRNRSNRRWPEVHRAGWNTKFNAFAPSQSGGETILESLRPAAAAAAAAAVAAVAQMFWRRAGAVTTSFSSWNSCSFLFRVTQVRGILADERVLVQDVCEIGQEDAKHLSRRCISGVWSVRDYSATAARALSWHTHRADHECDDDGRGVVPEEIHNAVNPLLRRRARAARGTQQRSTITSSQGKSTPLHKTARSL
jgi:hypothetical protein